MAEGLEERVAALESEVADLRAARRASAEAAALVEQAGVNTSFNALSVADQELVTALAHRLAQNISCAPEEDVRRGRARTPGPPEEGVRPSS